MQDEVDVQFGVFGAQCTDRIAAHWRLLLRREAAPGSLPVARLGQGREAAIGGGEEQLDPLVRRQGLHQVDVSPGEHQACQRRAQGDALLELDIEHLVGPHVAG
ncbi:hypothetical protein D3C80_500170 [compost metagenome]